MHPSTNPVRCRANTIQTQRFTATLRYQPTTTSSTSSKVIAGRGLCPPNLKPPLGSVTPPSFLPFVDFPFFFLHSPSLSIIPRPPFLYYFLQVFLPFPFLFSLVRSTLPFSFFRLSPFQAPQTHSPDKESGEAL